MKCVFRMHGCPFAQHTRQLCIKAVLEAFKQHDLAPGDVPPCLHCRICDPTGARLPMSLRMNVRLPSTWEAMLYRILVAEFPGEEAQCEVDVVHGWQAPVDVYLPAHGLVLMVDGEGHHADLHGGAMHGMDTDQKACDHRFNARVLLQPPGWPVKGVLRLHCRDTRVWASHIRRAIGQCAQLARFMMFTPSFHLLDLAWC